MTDGPIDIDWFQQQLKKHNERFEKTKPTMTAYEAGQDAGYNGPSQTNCHFAFFMSAESTAEWERGKAEAERE